VHTIFLVHGMGDFAAGWSAPIQTALRQYYDPARYAFLQNFPFKQNFTFVEITYNNFFTEYLAQARQQAAALAKWDQLTAGLTGEALGILQKVVAAASSAPADNFLVNYLGDVAFYMATDIGQEIKSDIVSQIGTGLGGASYDSASNNWSVIAHSLGTRVMTEVLQAGFTAAPSLESFGKAQVLMQVANVSKLLEDILQVPYKTGDVYHNAVYPSDTSANGVCGHFINATHRLDPFAFIDEFDPGADFGDGNALLDSLYHPVKLPAADITSWDVHALDHYMLHPAVHTTLFQYLLPGLDLAGPTADEMSAAMAAYRKLTLESAVSNAWTTELTNLKSDPFSTLTQVFGVWQKYGNLLAQARQKFSKAI
jgi:hypothetical protein